MTTGPGVGSVARAARSVWRRARAARSLLDLEVETEQATVMLDHLCADSGDHRLLGVELTAAELERVRANGEVVLPVGCDRCLWERRLIVRQPRAVTEKRAIPA